MLCGQGDTEAFAGQGLVSASLPGWEADHRPCTPPLLSATQFVEFGKYKNKGEALASELLAELPGQFLAYTKVRNIMPPAPPSAPPMH